MKKSATLLTALALLITVSSCKKIKEATNRDIEITPTAITFTLPVINTTNAGTSFGSQNVNLDLDALIKAQASEFDENNIKNAKVTSVTVEILNSDAANNVANFENLSLTLQTGTGSPVAVASATSIPDTQAASLTVPVSGNSEVRNFLTAASFKYELVGKLRRVTTKELQLKVTAKYELTVGL